MKLRFFNAKLIILQGQSLHFRGLNYMVAQVQYFRTRSHSKSLKLKYILLLKTLKLFKTKKNKNSNSTVSNFDLNWKCAILILLHNNSNLKKHCNFFNTPEQTLLSNENFTDFASYMHVLHRKKFVDTHFFTKVNL